MDENQSVQMTFVVYPVCVNTCPTKEISTKMKKRGRARRLEDQSLQMAVFVNKSLLGKIDAHVQENWLLV
jgi:Fe-S-cluster-containing dehydrogenase component